MNTILAIAFGGAFGAILRHGANVLAHKTLGGSFPVATIGVNVLGSFLMGALIVTLANSWQPSPEMRAFMVTGLLGAFTTFSTFSLDVAVLYERGDLMNAGLYIALSVVGGIFALFLGMTLIRSVIS